MSKIFIVEDCTKCPNFIPCTSPKDFRVGCTKLGNLGSPLNLISGGIPIDCPLNDYEKPKTGHWIHYASHDECSECRWSTGKYLSPSKYCPDCGAKMTKSEVSDADSD